MHGIAAPHGGVLVNLELKGAGRRAALRRARRLPSIRLSQREQSDLLLLATGALSPLRGFMTREDYHSVLDEMRLADGTAWTLPISLPVTRSAADRLREGRYVRLAGAGGQTLGIMRVEDRYRYDPLREARAVYRTTDDRHPGVQRLYRQGEVLLGGPVWLLNRPVPDRWRQYHLDPAQTRRLFAERGWRLIVGFQTRNPIHRAHEYIQKCALEIADGLLLHPLVGETKEGDVPAVLRMESYRVVCERYYPQDRLVLAVFPAAMRYAGPREAVFHAICRKNFGCSHFIVGRDHAGVGDYYGPYDAQRIFSEFTPQELGVTPLFFENAFYCRACGNMATAKTCPHGEESRLSLSGTGVRALLQKGEAPPAEYTRPEVAEVLMAAYREPRQAG